MQFKTLTLRIAKKKLLPFKNLHWELLQSLNRLWGWRDEYERLVMWWVFLLWGGHKTSHEDPTSQFSFQTISLKKIPSSCFVSWDFWWVGFFFLLFNLERYLTESWQILKTPPEKKNVTQEETQKNAKKLELVKQGAFKKAPFKAWMHSTCTRRRACMMFAPRGSRGKKTPRIQVHKHQRSLPTRPTRPKQLRDMRKRNARERECELWERESFVQTSIRILV